MSSAALPNTAQPAGANPRPASRATPWWELGYVVGMLMLSGVAGLLAVRAAVLFSNSAGIPFTTDRLLVVMIAVIEAACCLLVLGRAWSTSGGDLVAELGLGRSHRLWLLALAIGAELAFQAYNLDSALRSPLCGLGLHVNITPGVVALARETPGWFVLFVFALVVLSPASEELMFRGWLWTALRRSWGPWPVALATGGLFWVMHAAYGWTYFLMLLPLAVMLTVVRQFTGSIRGTLALHVVHNAGVVALTLVLLRAC